MEHDGGSGNESSPDTVLARSSSDEDRGRKLGSTSGEYVTVAGSSSSLDTPVSGGGGGVAPTVAAPAAKLNEDKRKRRFAILKSSFRKDGGLFRTKKKNRASEDPDEKEKDWSGKLERQQREDERSEAASSKKKKKKKTHPLVRKLSLNKFRLSTEHEGQRVAKGGESSRSQSQSSQESTSHSDSPSKLSRKGSDGEKVTGGNRGERRWESHGGRGQLEKPVDEKPIEKAIERPISSVVVVQRRSPSLTIRSIPKNPEYETQQRNAEELRRCTSTLPYAISKWPDRPSESTVDAARKTRLSTKADSESSLPEKTSPLAIRRKLSLLEEKRAIFQRRPLDSSQETDSGETVIAVSLDEDSVPESAAKQSQQENRENASTKRKARHISVRKFDTFSTFEGTFDEDTGLGYLAGIEEDHTETYDHRQADVAAMSPTVGNGNDVGASTSTAEKARSFSQESASSQNNAPNTGVIEKREHLYKILVIGELGTGKTSIIKRYVHQFFSQNYRATIGVDFALKVLNWDPHTIIRLQLWDIAGQERFGNMTRVYYKEAVGAFIVFDVTRSATLDAVVKWKQDLDSKVQLPDGSPIPCVLLANKCDQQKEGLVNSPAKMDEYCKEKNFVGWFETSAKENINIEEAARFLVTKILQNDQMMRGNGTQDQTDGERFALNQSPTTSKKSCSC